jgi:hypothetical protein
MFIIYAILRGALESQWLTMKSIFSNRSKQFIVLHQYMNTSIFCFENKMSIME